jgi:methionine biosynthesis protein MetW
MNRLKPILRKFPPYIWLANQYRTVRRLFIYPDTANIGVVDYDDYWDAKAQSGLGHLSPFRQARAEALARIIPPGSKVLDLGVGDGAILKYLIDHRQVDAYGLDISQKAVDFCQSIGIKADLADINVPIGEGIADHYDAIIMTEIIEHLPDPEALLNRLRDRADLLIVSIPNTGYHQHRLRLLMGKFPLQWVVTPGEHLRFWTMVDFRWWARQLGFQIMAEDAYRGTPLLRKVWPNLFGQAVVYALKDNQAN